MTKRAIKIACTALEGTSIVPFLQGSLRMLIIANISFSATSDPDCAELSSRYELIAALFLFAGDCIPRASGDQDQEH